MNIYQVLQIGEHHTNHCEDYALVVEVGNDHLVAAVMDGCSMGNQRKNNKNRCRRYQR